MQHDQTLKIRINKAFQQRKKLVKDSDSYRLFNGFYEGYPGIVLDRYGQTLVIFDHREEPGSQTEIQEIAKCTQNQLDWVESILLKQRKNPDQHMKNGALVSGEILPTSIQEYGVRYTLDLQMNQDASFYLDTRNLRLWLLENSTGLRVLNTFAYTGSLGVAAGMGGATEVAQTDLSKHFLDIARKSWALNELDNDKLKIIPGDYFRITGRLRHENKLFDCVIIDPPYFSRTSAGRVDLQNGMTQLVNKVRPLVAHQGRLVIINNALYLSGSDFIAELNALCESEYISLDQIVTIPQDITGYPTTVVDKPPVDPAPFNHPTKIAILKVTRKDQRKL